MSKTRADEKLDNLINKTKGKYITQGVSFNKDCERQMGLLRYALEESASFSGLVKEMLAQRKDNISNYNENSNIVKSIRRKSIELDLEKIKNDWL